MPAQIHSTSHESSTMAWAGVEIGSKILVRCTGLSIVHISLLERAHTLLRICYPRARSRYIILARLSNTLAVIFSGSLLCLACPGSWQLRCGKVTPASEF